MDLRLFLEDRQALPLPFGERVVQDLTLRHCLTAITPADQFFLLAEARRILLPGGVLHLVLAAGDDEVMVLQLANRLGMNRVRDSDGAPGGESEQRPLHFRKPERRASGAPSVSVAIPAYSPRFFEQSLASAIAQTYANLEIIVCDDSAGNEIEEITQRLALTRKVRYLRNPVRLRGRGNYAKCFAVAGGEFIKYLNDDDVLMPDCVQRLVEAFRLAPDIVLATSYRLRIDETGSALPDQPATRPLVDRDMIVNGMTLVNAMLMAGLNVVGEPTSALFRRIDLQQAIPDQFRFDSPDCMGVIDMAMWSALLLKGDAVYLRDGLSHFRIHAGQQQHDPAIQQPTVQAIRSLQATWLKLGLYAGMKPDTFLTRNFPGPHQAWQPHPFAPLRSLPAGRMWWT